MLPFSGNSLYCKLPGTSPNAALLLSQAAVSSILMAAVYMRNMDNLWRRVLSLFKRLYSVALLPAEITPRFCVWGASLYQRIRCSMPRLFDTQLNAASTLCGQPPPAVQFCCCCRSSWMKLQANR